MWFVILPVVMSIGTIATIIANYTPIFEIVGKPFVPFLELLQIPEASHASQTILIGFADMFYHLFSLKVFRVTLHALLLAH